MTSFINWIHDHDNRWSFILPYVGGAILLSIFMSMFWVAMLMIAHLLLELWRFSMLKIERPLLHALWHTKLDFSLVIVAFVFAVYAELIIGLLGLSYAARGAQAVARFGVIERSIRSGLLIIDELGLLAKAFAKGKKNDANGKPVPAAAGNEAPSQQDMLDEALHYDHDEVNPWKNPTKGDWFSIGFAVACLTLIVMAPHFTTYDYHDIGHIILEELHPWSDHDVAADPAGT